MICCRKLGERGRAKRRAVTMSLRPSERRSPSLRSTAMRPRALPEGPKVRRTEAKQNKRARRFSYCVELEGVEPSSKRGSHMLSTCLSLHCFSSKGRCKATNRYLILYNLTFGARTPQAIPDLPAPPYRRASGRELPGDVSSQHLVPRLSFDLLCFNQAARA